MLNLDPIRNPELKRFFAENFEGTMRGLALGAPIVADDDKIVVSTDMKVGKYTIAAQPDIPRSITAKVTAVETADTPGILWIRGTNIHDEIIEEHLNLVVGSTVETYSAFKTVTDVEGTGWKIDAEEGDADKLIVGIGNKLGLPVTLKSDLQVPIAVLGTALVIPTVKYYEGLVHQNTVDLSTGTYNGTKAVLVVVVQ